jgi:hypothetical protein
VGTLARAGEIVFSDELNHASIIDGCRLSRAETFVYGHKDVEHLAWGLSQAGGRGALIVTESVFSMDGDVAPLEEIVALARLHGVRVAVDEAHATGCLGPGGRGAVAAAGLEREVDVVIGTLGKALGAYGAFVACDAGLAQLFTNSARSLIFSTAPPPPAAAGALAALELLEEQPRRVDRLRSNAAVLRAELAREGFGCAGSETQIIPLVVGDAQTAMRVCEAALEGGVFAQAIRPPTVPEGTSRLRLAVMATHTQDELRAAARTLGQAALEAGWRPAIPVGLGESIAAGKAVFDGEALVGVGGSGASVRAPGSAAAGGAAETGPGASGRPAAPVQTAAGARPGAPGRPAPAVETAAGAGSVAPGRAAAARVETAAESHGDGVPAPRAA